MRIHWKLALAAAGAIGLLSAGASLTGAGQDENRFQGDSSINRIGVIRMRGLQLPNMPAIPIDQLNSIADLNGKLYGGARGRVVALSETGQATQSFQIAVELPKIAAHSGDSLLVGDPQRKLVHAFNTKTGKLSEMFRLADVKDPAPTLVPESDLLKTGEMMSVASNGRHVYVAVGGGFSSSIFKIDPATKQITARSWATGPDPQSMAYHNGGLYVLVGRGRQLRKFSDSLQPSRDKIDLPVSQSRGVVIRGEEIRLLAPAEGGVIRLKVDPSVISHSALISKLDRIQVMEAPHLKIDPSILTGLTVRKFAVLICGDLAENFWGECFWNDTLWMYNALRAAGYSAENIIVLYGDGADYISANPKYRHPVRVTDFAASPSKVNLVLDGLKNGDAVNGIPRMDSNDTLFMWTFDHGGGNSNAYLCLRGGTISDTAMATKMDAISYGKRVILMQQCRSGGFIDNLQNNKTFISTACRADQNAQAADTENEVYAGRDYSHGEYNYYVISAIKKAAPDGGSVNADSTSNGKVSAFEAHEWNRTHESRPEVPQKNDMGGVGAAFDIR